MTKWMTSRQWAVTLGLVLLVALAITGLFLTRDSTAPSQAKFRRAQPVDEKPLQTARAMATLASDRQEQRYARQAVNLADHEVDLAFNSAMRYAEEHPPQPTPQTKELFARASKAETQLKADQDRIDQLKKQLAAAPASRQDAIQQRIDVTHAQLELDEDESEDAKNKLMRSGADPLGRIRRQFARHEAAQHQDDANHPQDIGNNAGSNYQTGHFVGQFRNWYAIHGKLIQLKQARDEASQTAAALDQTHDSLEQTLKGKEAPQQPQPVTGQTDSADDASAEKTKAAIVSLRQLSSEQKDLVDLDKRTQDEQELASVYDNWIVLSQSYQRAAVHDMVRSALWILLLVLAAYIAGRAIDRFTSEQIQENTRLRPLRLIFRFAIQVLAALLILLVIFGAPAQLSTIIGLATAAITLALKDFILAFLGWFVLIGRNGIRVGDWVEIKGVMGEVAEISLMRTVLLESGNWTDTGHPTGRKVTFMNGYAIEGHYFNFSTTGQWLWDEIQILVPADQSPYPMIDTIQKLVTKETETNAQAAEQEWQRATGHYRVMNPVSAAPAVHLKPTGPGVEIHIRYITHANERSVVRARLYQGLAELLHGRDVQQDKPANIPVTK